MYESLTTFIQKLLAVSHLGPLHNLYTMAGFVISSQRWDDKRYVYAHQWCSLIVAEVKSK